jgi:uroporphyrin-III C-methyltransferase/precorrin-2 dehydrogenase/sirohydrochlorin ferrochelatase
VNPYPLGLILTGRRVLVVGGGAVATRRVPALLASEAQVVLVAPTLTPSLHALAADGRIVWHARTFTPSDVDDAWLVHVAVDDPEAARAVSAAAEQRRVFCVRADDRHAASAWTPATTRHGPVTVAVTAGGDPRRAMAVRDAIHDLLASTNLTGADGAAGARSVTGADGAAGARSVTGADGAADARTLTGADGAAGDRDLTGGRVGRVALVGGGPGDPELITVKGRRLLAAADVVVVDRLAPGLLLDELRPEVELIDASKIPYGPAATQEEINRLLVEHARTGKFVVRLKGGDPYLFGRGGEEVLACTAAGIPVTLVPGVSSAIAAPGTAGIPVTHRGVAHELVVVTGHIPPGHPDSLVDWPAVARMRGTVCVLMGLTHLAAITSTLVANGRAARTPAAVVQDGSTGSQRVVRATLDTIASEAAAHGVRPPAVVVIGEVVDVLKPITGWDGVTEGQANA